MSKVEEVALALRNARMRYYVQGTSDNEFHGPPYRAPWYIIDGLYAEYEVGYPGDLVGEFDDGQSVYDALDLIFARAAIDAMENK